MMELLSPAEAVEDGLGSEDFFQAFLNILEDFHEEKIELQNLKTVMLNILEDAEAEKEEGLRTYRAVVNILDDLGAKRARQNNLQRAMLNILDDFNDEKHRLEANQSAIINILDDYEDEKQKVQDALDNLRRTQDQLVQAEKLASLGSLVAGVAHEINTPVGIAVTAVSYLQDEFKKVQGAFDEQSLSKSQLLQFFESGLNAFGMITKNLQRSAELIASFKSIAVDQTSFDKREINFREYLEDILRSLRPAIKRCPITINTECDADIGLYTFPGAWSQIFTNLVMNSSIHAFEDGEAGVIDISIHERDGVIHIVYADSGKGISPEIEAKIFDPFVTSRRGEGGSGLGMHIVANLVHNTLGGKIHLDKVEGKGAVFVIEVPVGDLLGTLH